MPVKALHARLDGKPTSVCHQQVISSNFNTIFDAWLVFCSNERESFNRAVIAFEYSKLNYLTLPLASMAESVGAGNCHTLNGIGCLLRRKVVAILKVTGSHLVIENGMELGGWARSIVRNAIQYLICCLVADRKE